MLHLVPLSFAAVSNKRRATWLLSPMSLPSQLKRAVCHRIKLIQLFGIQPLPCETEGRHS